MKATVATAMAVVAVLASAASADMYEDRADLLYDPATGNIKLDSAEASGGVFLGYQIFSGSGPAVVAEPWGEFRSGNHVQVLDGAIESYPWNCSESGNPFGGGTAGILDIGDIAPMGLDLVALTDLLYMTAAEAAAQGLDPYEPTYVGQLGSGQWNLDLVIVGGPTVVAGDADCDGDVDINDLSALACNWGETVGQQWLDGNFDHDGDVDVNDLAALAGNWGYGTEGGMSLDDAMGSTGIPEPASLALLGLGAMALLRRRRSA